MSYLCQLFVYISNLEARGTSTATGNFRIDFGRAGGNSKELRESRPILRALECAYITYKIARHLTSDSQMSSVNILESNV